MSTGFRFARTVVVRFSLSLSDTVCKRRTGATFGIKTFADNVGTRVRSPSSAHFRTTAVYTGAHRTRTSDVTNCSISVIGTPKRFENVGPRKMKSVPDFRYDSEKIDFKCYIGIYVIDLTNSQLIVQVDQLLNRPNTRTFRIDFNLLNFSRSSMFRLLRFGPTSKIWPRNNH